MPLHWTSMPSRMHRPGLALALGFAAAFCMATPTRADAQAVRPSTHGPTLATRPTGGQGGPSGPFTICRDQTYALCAASSCYVYNEVAYCACDIEQGDSISLKFDVDGGDVCDVNANGPANGYMVSTFSLPDSVLKPDGDMALYTCQAGSDGAYGQCDGGLCFTSTAGVPSFPGFDAPLAANEIICSCPITTQKKNSPIGYQIAGPFPCEQSFFDNCDGDVTNDRTGSYIPVGAPVGSARFLALMLDGAPLPPLNECKPEGSVGGCIPDAGANSGNPLACPLYGESTMLPPNSGVDCATVCDQYDACSNDEGVQVAYTCDATICTTQDEGIFVPSCEGLQGCALAEAGKAEIEGQCSCCGSQLCDCTPNAATNEKITELNALQIANGDEPQCEINGTLCGAMP